LADDQAVQDVRLGGPNKNHSFHFSQGGAGLEYVCRKGQFKKRPRAALTEGGSAKN